MDYTLFKRGACTLCRRVTSDCVEASSSGQLVCKRCREPHRKRAAEESLDLMLGA